MLTRIRVLSRQALPPHTPAVLHHEHHLLQRGGVVQRVSAHGDDVRRHTGGDPAAVPVDTNQARGIDRHRLQDQPRREAGLDRGAHLGHRQRAPRLSGHLDVHVAAERHRRADTLRATRPFETGAGRLEAIFEVFNITNADNFRDPASGSLLFNFDGTVRNGLGDPRQAQLGVRYVF